MVWGDYSLWMSNTWGPYSEYADVAKCKCNLSLRQNNMTREEDRED